MRKPAVLVLILLLLCAANGVALFLLFAESAESPSVPGTRPVPRARPGLPVREVEGDAFALALPWNSGMMGPGPGGAPSA